MQTCALSDEIKLDTMLRELVHVAILLLHIEALIKVVFTWLVLDFNVAVVLHTTGECRSNNRCPFDLAKSMCWP